MATPIPDGRFLDIFRAEGIRKIRPHAGWKNHNRGNRGTGWGPINGVLIHHTGSDTSGDGTGYNSAVLWPGYSSLPGPLCHVGIAPDGTLHVNSNGRANHAGLGARAVLNAVVAEAQWLMSREARPTTRETDGNSRLYGAEIMYSGSHEMTAAQYDTAVRFAAAICRHYGWSARSVIGHREWSYTKPDPGHCSMVEFRKAVEAQLAAGPGGTAGGAAGGIGGTPTPQGIYEEIMSYYKDRADFEAALKRIIREVVRDVINGFLTNIPAPSRVKDKVWGLWFYLKNIDEWAYKGGVDAAVARSLAEAQAKKGSELTNAEISAITEAAERGAREGAAGAIDEKIDSGETVLRAETS